MTKNSNKLKVAVVQAASVLFNRDATIEKACDLIQKASREGVRLIVFPEAFVPAYPRGLTFGTVVGSRQPAGRKVWQAYWENSVEIPGPATAILGEAARKANVYLAIGVIERDPCAVRAHCIVPCFTSDLTAGSWANIKSLNRPRRNV